MKRAETDIYLGDEADDLFDEMTAKLMTSERGFALLDPYSLTLTPGLAPLEAPIDDVDEALGEKYLAIIADGFPESKGPSSFEDAGLNLLLRRADEVVVWYCGMADGISELLLRRLADQRLNGIVLILTTDSAAVVWYQLLYQRTLLRVNKVDLLSPGKTVADVSTAYDVNRLIFDWPLVVQNHRKPELQRFCSYILAKGLSLEQVLREAMYLNDTSFIPPLSRNEVSAIAIEAKELHDKLKGSLH